MNYIFNYNINNNKLNKNENFDTSGIKKYLKKKDEQLLFDFNRFKNVNTYLIKENFLILKINGLRCIILKNNVWFITNNKNIISEFEKINKEFLIQYNNDFILSIIEYIIDILIKDGERKVNEFNRSFEFNIKKNYKNSSLKFKDLYFINIETNDLYELYSDIIELLQYLLENNDDLDGIINICDEKNKQLIEELENILENGINILKDLINDFKNIQNKIDNYKNITEIHLDSVRNNIAILTVNIEFMSLLFSFGAFISSIFGMNLSNEMEELDGGTYMIFSICIMFMSFMGYVYLRRYKNYIGINNTLEYEY